MTWTTIEALLPVFFVVGLGYCSGRWRLVDNSNVTALNTIVMTIAVPISLFTILASAKRSDVADHLLMALVVLLAMCAVYSGVYILQRRTSHAPPADAAIEALTVAFPNAAAVGLPLAKSVLGPTGELAVAVTLAIGSVTLSPLTILIVERHSQASPSGAPGRTGARSIVSSLAKPIVVAPVLGLVLSLTGLPVPQVVVASLSEIGSVAAGLALFLTGLVLSAQPVRLTAPALVSTFIGVFIRPALAYLLALLLALPPSATAETVLIMALPAGFFGILLGLNLGVRPGVAGTTLLLSSLVSAVSLPLVITWASG